MRFLRNRALSVAILLLCSLRAADSAELQAGFYATHRSEPFLLNRRIEPALLAGLRIWDAHLATWRIAQPAEVVGARPQVIVLHLWADWCAPCRAEFPVVRELMSAIARAHGDRVQFVLLSETSSPEAMRSFLDKQRASVPAGPHYLDYGEGVAALLRRDLPAPLSYPMTLVLDGERVVRHAVVGPVTDRRAALLATISLLLAESPKPAQPARGR